MPLPHQFVTAALTAQRTGQLDWRWLWTNVAVPIMADAALVQAYDPLLDCLRAASTNVAGANPGDPVAAPATSRAASIADDPTGHLIEVARRHVNSYLEGLRAPVGIATQLLALQSTTNTLGASLNASINRPKTNATLQDKCPMLIAALLAVCEVPNVNDLPV